MVSLSLVAVRRWIARAMIGVAGAVVVLAGLLAWLFNNRPGLDEIGVAPPLPVEAPDGAVTATWLGVTTILFDDGDTQILIDGFFSRPSLGDIVFGVPVESDAAQINLVMDRYDMRRLVAIIPVHSHFDHAMDVGAIANRSNASILGTESTAQIARGAGVPEDQIVTTSGDERYAFGQFTVTLIVSNHAPIGWGGSVPLAGTVDEPLETPAPITAWREGGSFTIVVAHPQGTTLVQGSAGQATRSMKNVRADVVMLGTYGLDDMGNDYTRRYWQTFVTGTGALRVFPIHFDDYTQPFGEIKPFPRILDDFGATMVLLENLRQIWDTDTRIYLPEFGKPMVLYAQPAPEA